MAKYEPRKTRPRKPFLYVGKGEQNQDFPSDPNMRNMISLLRATQTIAEMQHNEQWPEELKQLVNNARRVQALFAFFGVR